MPRSTLLAFAVVVATSCASPPVTAPPTSPAAPSASDVAPAASASASSSEAAPGPSAAPAAPAASASPEAPPPPCIDGDLIMGTCICAKGKGADATGHCVYMPCPSMSGGETFRDEATGQCMECRPGTRPTKDGKCVR